jgi:hypothetical protein
MGEGFEIFLRDWGPESLTAFFVLSVGLGLLIPRWSVNKTVAILEKRISEALEREQYHRSANEKLQETVRLQAEQLGDLMEQGRTTVALVGSIADQASIKGGGRHAG